jgi:hypothetical protein
MRTATDHLDILVQLLEAGIPLASVVGLQIFILQEEWNKLPYSSKLSLSPLKTTKVLRFIDLDELFHSEIYALRKIYGTGIAQNNYYILSYCRNQGITLVTSDDIISKIAKGLKIEVRRPEAFGYDIAMKIKDEPEVPVKIRVKKKNNMST